MMLPSPTFTLPDNIASGSINVVKLLTPSDLICWMIFFLLWMRQLRKQIRRSHSQHNYPQDQVPLQVHRLGFYPTVPAYHQEIQADSIYLQISSHLSAQQAMLLRAQTPLHR